MNHFSSLIDRLTLDDIEILNCLTQQESLNRFSAKTKREVLEGLKLSESKIRKSLGRLEAMNFIDIVAGSREHLVFVNEFGQMAINQLCERSNV